MTRFAVSFSVYHVLRYQRPPGPKPASVTPSRKRVTKNDVWLDWKAWKQETEPLDRVSREHGLYVVLRLCPVRIREIVRTV